MEEEKRRRTEKEDEPKKMRRRNNITEPGGYTVYIHTVYIVKEPIKS
jgi:hypothetical protein